jgi:hypothetical protein
MSPEPAPGPPELSLLLGKARTAWDALRTFLDGLEGVTGEWKFYGEKHGWQLKLVAHKRALLYLIPRDGRFTAALALRDPAIATLRAAGIPDAVVREIEAAKPSPEGKPARVEVRGARELPLVKKLVAAKLAATAKPGR